MTYSYSRTRLEPITRQITGLASGTLAGLTGVRHYEALDEIRHTWLAWEMALATPHETWQASWEAYRRSAA